MAAGKHRRTQRHTPGGYSNGKREHGWFEEESRCRYPTLDPLAETIGKCDDARNRIPGRLVTRSLLGCHCKHSIMLGSREEYSTILSWYAPSMLSGL